LRLSNQKVADGFWDRIFHVSQNKIEVIIDLDSKLAYKYISTLWSLLLLRLVHSILIIWTSLTRWALSILRIDSSILSFVSCIVGEKIVLLRINNRFTDYS